MWDAKWDSHFEKHLDIYFQNKQTLTPSINLTAPWYLQRKWKTYVHTKACMWIFIPALLIIAKT
jgi:hypothetical protein